MDRVHPPGSIDPNAIKHAAIAVGIPDLHRPHQLHAGVVFRKATDSLRLLHLQFHHALAEDEVENSFFIVECDFIEERLQAVSALCRRIARRYLQGGVPYGLTPPNDVFDSAMGRLLLSPTDTGLTCATFVLAIFQAARLTLVDLETWPPADELDRRWQHWIAAMLRQHTNDEAHADAVLDEVGAGRIRPEHVAAAAIQGTHPVSRSDIEGDAHRVADQLFDRHRNELLDQHDDLVTLSLRELIEAMYRNHRLTPFNVRLELEQEACVRYHHPSSVTETLQMNSCLSNDCVVRSPISLTLSSTQAGKSLSNTLHRLSYVDQFIFGTREGERFAGVRLGFRYLLS